MDILGRFSAIFTKDGMFVTVCFPAHQSPSERVYFMAVLLWLVPFQKGDIKTVYESHLP